MVVSNEVPCNLDERKEGDDEEYDEIVDPHETLRECCAQKAECVSLKDKLDECNVRVESRSRTSESCVEEVIHYLHCVEQCAAKNLFSMLK